MIAKESKELGKTIRKDSNESDLPAAICSYVYNNVWLSVRLYGRLHYF